MAPRKKRDNLEKTTPKARIAPSLKSASGAGFTFEDKATATLLCEMLMGFHSLGAAFGPIQRLERQAGDWEPFGDLLLNTSNSGGQEIHCGVSIKSNRLINANGCDVELCAGMWATLANPVFKLESDFILLISAPLSQTVSDHIGNLCRQARALDAGRFDKKVVHANVRKIYQSFLNPNDATLKGRPGNLLAKLIHREFDFEASVSRTEKDALHMCRELLQPEERNEERVKDLWKQLCEVSLELRLSGGSVTRTDVSAKLRQKFSLKDDPSDDAAWTKIRILSREAIDEIGTSLPGGIKLLQRAKKDALRSAIEKTHGCYVIGDSGSGKSAIIKEYADEVQATGGEVVWIKGERFGTFIATVPKLPDVLARCRKRSALLVVDALDGCTTPELFAGIARLVTSLGTIENSPWSLVFTCQTPDWTRVYVAFIKHLPGHSVLIERVECGLLDNEDFDLVCGISPTVAKLAREPKLRRFLSSPKMLDVLLSGQFTEGRTIAGEADLIEWWWEQQVRGPHIIAPEERVARELAYCMANELRSELPPDSVAGAEEAASRLIRNRVLKRTRDGLLRFEHDLLADWSRVMYLRGLGQAKFQFLKVHTENPPWLRAVRLLSQHLLDRVDDLKQWREFLNSSKSVLQAEDDLPAEDLQIIDAWLEGVIFSLNPGEVMVNISADLFGDSGWLLRRLIRRMMLVASIPDPAIQNQLSKVDPKSAEAAAARYRLPLWKVWSPIIDFLISHPEQATELIPVELGEIAEIGSRMEDYVKLEWPQFAELIIANAEKELQREAAGKYRHDPGPRPLGGNSKSRKTIYLGALLAASQLPEKVGKLVSKAAGIAPWEDGDITPETKGEWRGEWTEPPTIFRGQDYVEMPASAWPCGPMRKTSRDFSHAWYDTAASIRLYRVSPETACKATMGFLIDWPKRTLSQIEHPEVFIDHFGFSSKVDHIDKAFYSQGPFLQFLRTNWISALNLIVQLTNFATERYSDWWPYDNKPRFLTFSTTYGETSWCGNHQIYAWSRDKINTAEPVTSALMALEKWLEEQIEKNEEIKPPLQVLYVQGHSLAFAGLLIALGKRYPELFLDELKPMLFIRELYMLDMQSVREQAGNGYSFHDTDFMNNLRAGWERLEGRRVGLLDLILNWLVGREDFRPVLDQVVFAWRAAAQALPESSKDRLPVLRWAAQFDFSNWKNVTLEDGRNGWMYQQPEDLSDQDAAAANLRKRALLTIPYQCSEVLERRLDLSSEQLSEIWEQLHNWKDFENASQNFDDSDELESSLRDHRHARAGLIAVLFCLGSNWVDKEESRRPWLEDELGKLLIDPPRVQAFTANDIHDDCEGFLARSVVRCWSHSSGDSGWRAASGNFICVYRYRTVQRLFEEAFLNRSKLGPGYRDLEALALSFSVVRRKANIGGIKPKPELIKEWLNEWMQKYADGHGPKWTDKWATIEVVEPFPPVASSTVGAVVRQSQRKRRNYGLDIHVLLASFGYLPALQEAQGNDERNHWLKISGQLLEAYLRTLPTYKDGDDNAEWDYEIWKVDTEIFKICAIRLLECKPEEQLGLWTPILDLPPAAHHHITNFLSEVLFETIRFEPVRVTALIPLWRSMVEHLLASPKWAGRLRYKEDEVLKTLFLYGRISSVRDKDYAPLVASLRDLYGQHVRTIGQDPYSQSSFAALLVSDAGEQLLVDAFKWLNSAWQDANPYFWERVVENSQFEKLLQRAWQKRFNEIRQTPEAFKAFKILALNLASQQVATAIAIQEQIASM